MIGCLRTRVRKKPIIARYFESETVLQFNNLEARLVYCECYCSAALPRDVQYVIGVFPDHTRLFF